MRVTAERIDKVKAQVTVEIPEDEFEISLQKAYKTVVKKINVPGFRKGKTPRRILEKMYGREILMEEALKDAIPSAYDKALAEIKDEYTAVSEPQYELVQTEKEKPIIFKAVFDIKPEVKLGKYKGLELTKQPVDVKEEDIDAEIDRMRERYAKLKAVEEAAAEGDILTIDFEGKLDGEAFSGGSAENYSLQIGSHSLIEGFEEQLVGSKPGETREVEVTFPENYHSPELAGKKAVFTVTVKEIKRKELAPLDDEFAKDVSEFDTLQELRLDIENKLKEAAKKRSENELRSEAVKKAAENAQLEIPRSMIERQAYRMAENFAMQLQGQGLSLEYYFKATDTKPEDLIKSYLPAAEDTVRTDLVLEAIAKAENIKVSAEEIEAEISKMAEQLKQEPARVREVAEKQGQISSLEFGIMIRKAVDLIITEATIKNAGE
ncbi:MAG: trigger factor [Peptococcaceae bacterium]|nr:trigger factor [Peptococcaceae bacterium]MDH7524201.1 trigger factor [Peptococcaceae bacterium]